MTQLASLYRVPSVYQFLTVLWITTQNPILKRRKLRCKSLRPAQVDLAQKWQSWGLDPGGLTLACALTPHILPC
jgi:hypothetical protein